MKIAIKILWVVLGICLLPLAIALFSLLVAGLTGCAPDNASTCMVAGIDLREPLYIGMMMHWFALITLPFAALAGLALLILVAVRYVLGRRRAD